MENSDKIAKLDKYDTTVNVIGGLRDCSTILKAIDSYFHNEITTPGNEFDFRTEKSKSRIEHAVRLSFLSFRNQDHRDLIESIFKSNMPPQDKELILFWQFALNNRLFREISSRVYMKVYYSGRIGISKDDIFAYLKEFLSQNKALGLNWSESTIDTLATKYLNLLTKLNLLGGSRVKSFKHIKISTELLTLYFYFAKLYDPLARDILKSEMLPLSFVSTEDLTERLKKLSLKGFLKMDFNGVALNIELIHSYRGICDALYNRP